MSRSRREVCLETPLGLRGLRGSRVFFSSDTETGETFHPSRVPPPPRLVGTAAGTRTIRRTGVDGRGTRFSFLPPTFPTDASATTTPSSRNDAQAARMEGAARVSPQRAQLPRVRDARSRLHAPVSTLSGPPEPRNASSLVAPRQGRGELSHGQATCLVQTHAKTLRSVVWSKRFLTVDNKVLHATEPFRR